MSHELTSSIDTAQVVLYFFWIFFVGLILWLRREDRREGYPLETDTLAVVGPVVGAGIPLPKEFVLPHDEGIRRAPDFVRDDRQILAERVSKVPGFPSEPTGEPLLSGVGPASFAERSEHAELSQFDGDPVIVPMRVASMFTVNGGPDPRGWPVVGADGALAGVISDIWVDRADLLVRYLEIQLTAAPKSEGDDEAPPKEIRLIPVSMLGLDGKAKRVSVRALRADQFVHVPTTQSPDRVTLREEDQVSAFYTGGWFYAEPGRREPLL
jgi:photosynthetic reaction center H subunit